MLHRCYNPANSHYADYGGRGIRVCDAWRESFEAFLRDVGRRPSPAHTLDRVDNDGDYAPGNVRWATWVEQASNRRNNRLLTIGCETKTITAWASQAGLHRKSLMSRLARGWDPARAVSTPPR